MIDNFLTKNINTVWGTKIPKFVEYGFGQVEPNHLSGQRTGQSYAQLPAAADIELLQQGQFVKYDYAEGVVDFTGPGEWMMVFNEIKLYRPNQRDCEFAMIKDNYNARVYSPYDWERAEAEKHSRYYAANDVAKKNGIEIKDGRITVDGVTLKADYVLTTDEALDGNKTYYVLEDNEYTPVEEPDVEDIGTYYEKIEYAFNTEKVTAPADYYSPFYNEDPFGIKGVYKERMMPEGTKMVPRVLKTNVGDIYTTNTVDELLTSADVGEVLVPRSTDGILVKKTTANADTTCGMEWQIVKFYTMPDHQKGVKVMRIA